VKGAREVLKLLRATKESYIIQAVGKKTLTLILYHADFVLAGLEFTRLIQAISFDPYLLHRSKGPMFLFQDRCLAPDLGFMAHRKLPRNQSPARAQNIWTNYFILLSTPTQIRGLGTCDTIQAPYNPKFCLTYITNAKIQDAKLITPAMHSKKGHKHRFYIVQPHS
jgi:hypothetical protein